MLKLLTINDIEIPDPEGSLSVKKNDKYNEYEGEDGVKTIEVIREDFISGSVSYKGLTAEQVTEIVEAIELVSAVKIYDPGINAVREIKALIKDVKYDKKYYKNNISVWSLSFTIEEL
nr:MAG TPA: hypothetical protein [Caudoviricetes sp.]